MIESDIPADTRPWPQAPRLLHPDQALQEQLTLLASLRNPTHTERRLRAYAALRDHLEGSRGHLSVAHYADFLDHLPTLVARAAPVLWSNEMWILANRAAESYPAEGVRWSADQFVAPVQYWAYETDCVLDKEPRLRELGFTGIFSNLVACVDDLITDVHFLILPSEPFFPILAMDRLGTPVGSGVYVAAKLDFMRSTVIAQHAVAAGRGLRRDWKRKTGTDAPLVRVVTLRRQHATADGAAGTVDWSCRWIVSGHWRNQFLPASGGHRPTWIAPHVKGPDSAPLKPPAVTVFVVKR